MPPKAKGICCTVSLRASHHEACSLFKFYVQLKLFCVSPKQFLAGLSASLSVLITSQTEKRIEGKREITAPLKNPVLPLLKGKDGEVFLKKSVLLLIFAKKHF